MHFEHGDKFNTDIFANFVADKNNFMKRLIFLLLVLLALPAAAQRFPAGDVPEQKNYVYVDTVTYSADGHRMVTQVYLPKGEGPWPVVVYRTPYFNFPAGDMFASYRRYAENGMAFLIQRCRGTGGSEGTYEPNIYERGDGMALLEWLQDASWCSSIALTGCSYMGLTSWILGDVLPDKVKGMYVEHYGVDRHLSAYSSGAFRQDILTAWAIDNAKEPITKPEVVPGRKYYDEMMYMPQISMDADRLGAELPWYREWISHTDYTDRYWHEGFWGLLKSIPAKIDVPMTVVAGHFDHHMEGTLLGYEMLSDEVKSRSRLIVGGWDHDFKTTPKLEGIVNDKQVKIEDDRFNWLHTLLVEGRVPEHEVKVYAIGADKWLDLEEWPSASSKTLTWYAGTEESGLALKPSKKKGEWSYEYDPSDPVISVGGETLFSSNSRKGSILQEPAGYRDDILFFRSEPLDEPLMISGPLTAKVWFSSDCEDTAVAVKVSEERSDGKTYNIRTGIATLAFRDDKLGSRQTYTPGEIVEVTVEMLPIVWELQPGSRIRVDISSSDFPQYSIHSNHPGVWSEQTKVRTAHQTVWTGRKYPTQIIIPIL